MPKTNSCALCGAPIQKNRGSPFREGPFIGRYWCQDCWALHHDAHPETFGKDAASRKFNADQAARVRAKRAAGGAGSELLWEEGNSRCYLTPKGTFLIDIEKMPWSTGDEFDAARLRVFVKALQMISKSMPGYEDILKTG